MKNDHRRFQRLVPFRNYRKKYVIATEGETEWAYFCMFKNRETSLKIELLNHRYKCSPEYVLKRAIDYTNNNKLRDGDKVWVVIDRDSWPQVQLQRVYNDCTSLGYNLLVSNPCFEYWLLLHFEDGTSISNNNACLTRLKQYLPYYKKGNIEVDKLRPHITVAIQRASQKDQPSCTKWPQKPGTTVYRLVQELQEAQATCNSSIPI